MFKNLPHYIAIIILITAFCSLISYSLFFNPFQLSINVQYWLIRVLIYILFGWWLISLSEKKNVGDLIGLTIAIGAITFMCTDNRIIYNSITTRVTVDIICLAGFIATTIWLLYILFSKSKTLLGFMIMANTIISLFIFLPYGIPRMDNFGNELSCLPLYTLNSYTPFVHKQINIFSILLDIRFLSVFIFMIYILIFSFFQVIHVNYEDDLDEKILRTENSILQFFQAGVYFSWKIIQRLIFFAKNFFRSFWYNIWKQIESSVESYVYSFVIICTFIIPLIILRISVDIYYHVLNSKISFPTLYQLIIIIELIFLISTPIILVKLLKSNFKPFNIYKFNVRERPDIFIPIYITLFSIGLSSIINGIIENSFGNYFIFYLSVLIYAGIWGFINYQKEFTKKR